MYKLLSLIRVWAVVFAVIDLLGGYTIRWWESAETAAQMSPILLWSGWGCAVLAIILTAWLTRLTSKTLIEPPVMTAEEMLSEMTVVGILPPRDDWATDSYPFSKPLYIGRLLTNGHFEMYDEPVRYCYPDKAWFKVVSKRFKSLTEKADFEPTHWLAIN